MQSLQPQIVLAVVVASSFYKDFGYDLVVTSFSDGIHSPNSLHYSGNAVDLRTRNVREVDMMPIIGGINEVFSLTAANLQVQLALLLVTYLVCYRQAINMLSLFFQA